MMLKAPMADLERIARIIRETAAAEIMPRFCALDPSDVREKKPGDLVTVADIAAERRLLSALAAAAPGTQALGEESVAEDPARLELLGGASPVWVIDPIDGTANFAKNVPRFAVIVAYVVAGVVEAGWIYHPPSGRMMMAQRGAGAWHDSKRLVVAAHVRGEDLTGSAYGRTAGGVRMAKALDEGGRIGSVQNRGCSGLEYMEIAAGDSHFSFHSRSLPWDHAAGMLVVREAGGLAGFVDGSPYDPRVLDGKPLAAANAEAWRIIAETVATPAAPGAGVG
jgi:fructose-1,6-bisphosphatase/inositol monophosphatase family enzyme